ncbi:hypothetical protein ACFFMR_23125 [Micromonospora andamanensis]|uniref:Uncharacterized protein n=1 Tax=Micromonospora andamanensis TaxID=1287068 RepID=A0ABQ4I2M9_9ACTN|nr:hypothetical protein [Micromonospora andamanensis]GIJ12136.1 hypothetical protein Van01_53500 [Micromonospora andamanensis]
MTRRRRGLVRAVLRLGFLTVLAGAAWCAYDAASAAPARAAEKPPAATQDGPVTRTADLVRDLLTPVLAANRPAPEPVAPPPPQVADPPRPPSSDERPGRPAPAPPPTGDAPAEPPGRQVPAGPADQAPPGGQPGPPAAGPAELPAPAGGQPPQDTASPPVATTPAGSAPLSTDPTTSGPAPSHPASPRAAPDRADQAPPADRVAGPPAPSPHDRSAETVARLLEPLPEAVRDEVAAVVAAAGPLTDPLLAVLEELLGSGSLDSVVGGLDPVLAPILDLLEPVLDVLPPADGPPQPAPVPTPADPGTQPEPDPVEPPGAGVDPVPPVAPVRAHPGQDTARLVRSADQITRHGHRGSPASLSRSIEAGGQHDRDRQAERPSGQPPLSPAPGTSGAEQTPISHSGSADTAAAGWSPPAVSSRLTRLPPTRHRPSRSPRPGSRPA